MPKENPMEKIGSWLFIAGVIIAVIAGMFAPANSMWMGVIAVIGLIVGVLNITDREINKFLIAAIGLMLAADSLGKIGALLGEPGDWITEMFVMFSVFLGGAVIFPALKSVYEIAKS